MADGITITSNVKQLLEQFEYLPERVQTAVKTGLARGLILAEDNVRTRAELKFSGSRAGLASRLTSFVEQTGDALDGQIGFRKTRGFPYEYAQEYGAKAKGGAMAIPVSPEAKRLGERGTSAKDFPRQIFLLPGTHVLAETNTLAQFQKGGGGLTVHYVLVKSIKPRLRFRSTIEASLPMIAGEITEEVAKTI